MLKQINKSQQNFEQNKLSTNVLQYLLFTFGIFYSYKIKFEYINLNLILFSVFTLIVAIRIILIYLPKSKLQFKLTYGLMLVTASIWSLLLSIAILLNAQTEYIAFLTILIAGMAAATSFNLLKFRTIN